MKYVNGYVFILDLDRQHLFGKCEEKGYGNLSYNVQKVYDSFSDAFLGGISFLKNRK